MGRVLWITGLRQPVEGQIFAKPVGDIAQVDQQGGRMPFEDLGVKVFPFPAADAIDEVLHMPRSLFLRRQSIGKYLTFDA